MSGIDFGNVGIGGLRLGGVLVAVATVGAVHGGEPPKTTPTATNQIAAPSPNQTPPQDHHQLPQKRSQKPRRDWGGRGGEIDGGWGEEGMGSFERRCNGAGLAQLGFPREIGLLLFRFFWRCRVTPVNRRCRRFPKARRPRPVRALVNDVRWGGWLGSSV